MARKEGDRCDWCGVGLDQDDGYRLLWPKRNMGAAFCRLEHVVPWMMQKNDWHIWSDVQVPEDADARCARTGLELDEDALYLVRHRGEFRVADGFSSAEAVLAWAKAGGRYG